jgi:DNA primase
MSKQLLKLSDVFRGLDAEGVLRDLLNVHEINEVGDELIHSCRLPFGMHKNGDTNPSASLNKNELVFNCFTCGGGSIVWLVQNVLDIDRDSAIAELKNYASGLKVVPIEEFMDKLNKLFTDEEKKKYEIPIYNERILNRWVRTSDYLTSRGVSEKVQDQMQTGLDENRAEYRKVGGGQDVVHLTRVVIPHFINGKLVGWVARKVENIDGVSKYKNSKGFPRQYSLYNQDNVKDMDSVYVVESPMSVLVLKSRGIENVVATFGAKFSEPQVELLRNFREVTVFMDGDAPGRSASMNLIKALSNYTNVRVINTPDGEDPASLDKIPPSVGHFIYELSKCS